MDTDNDIYSISLQEENFTPETKGRWNSYGTYRLLLCAWMLNDTVILSAITEISHEGYYIRILLHIFGVIFIGIPLVYSEIAIAQYTNCTGISLWNFFPLCRGFGYGIIFQSFLRNIYLVVFTSWFLKYTFYSTMSPPPWFKCKEYGTNCIVKKINITVFQHCLEMKKLLDEDCGMKTASYYFFSKEIGNNNTQQNWPKCSYLWKEMLTSSIICLTLFLLTLKSIKTIQIGIKLTTVHTVLVIFVLLCASLSTNAAWYMTKVHIKWSFYDFITSFEALADSCLSVGTGQGIILYLSKDLPFRSAVIKTSIYTPLSSLFETIILSFIAFNGMSAMSHYHGQELYIFEEHNLKTFYTVFASMSEILNYFQGLSVSAFMWFSIGCVCIFMNLWINFLYIRSLVISNTTTTFSKNLLTAILLIFICLTTYPIYCADIANSIFNAVQIMQLFYSLIFSLSLYWIYGIKKHCVDILFMIGVKTSYFWKIAWFFSPVTLTLLIYSKIASLHLNLGHHNSYFIKNINKEVDELIVYTLLIIFSLVVVIGTIIEICNFVRFDKIVNIFVAKKSWGPADPILYRSRQMFIPDIMTREFLYRHIRIRGMYKSRGKRNENEKRNSVELEDGNNWSVLTSN